MEEVELEEEGPTTVPTVGVGAAFEVGEVDGVDLDLIVDEAAALLVTDTETPVFPLADPKPKVLDTQSVDV